MAVSEPEVRSRVYWFLADCILLPPAEVSTEVRQALQLRADEEDDRILDREFTRLLRGVQEGYGPPPPYESLYRRSEFPTDIVEAVIGCFQRGGFDAAAVCMEPPDFLGSELRLMSLLAYKEYEGGRNGDERQRQSFIGLQQEVLAKHLLLWVPDYCQVLMQASRVDYYRQLAGYLGQFLEYDRQYF